jgi:hypothetical protein
MATLNDNTKQGGRFLKKRHISRPRRLGTTRRKPKGLPSPSEAQGRAPARSLDNKKYLATSVHEWLQEVETPWDKWETKCFYQAQLLRSIHEIKGRLSGQIETVGNDLPLEMWHELNHLYDISRLELHDKAAKEKKPTPGESDIWVTALKRSLKTLPDLQPEEEKIIAALADTWKRFGRWESDYQRIFNCGAEWIGFKPKCCDDPAIAVPIGCNHRLCFKCNARRAETYRDKVRVMFERLEHPVFLTLTIPNVRAVSKRTYSKVRNAIRKLLKKHSGWMKGGLYSLETTYNRHTQTGARWHVHAHVLIDSSVKLPSSRPAFIRFKRRLEFDWLLLSGGRKSGWRTSDFDYWFHRTQQQRSKSAKDNFGGSADRRLVDVRRVTDRKKAAYEVLKYITKGSDFADKPEAVEQFLYAVRGTRMLQTFGSWYGFKFPEKVQTWDHLKCSCGKNEFERQGKLFAEGVYMEKGTGRWLCKSKIFKRGDESDA